MKIKGLIYAAVFAASIGISIAQSNVTNVSVTLKGGMTFNVICNPLNNTNNDTTNLFRFVASDGDQVYRWNPLIQDIDAPIYTYSAIFGWDPHFILNPGEGIFYFATGPNVTNTFVGEVIQGSYTNPVPVVGNVAFNLFGSSIPLGGSFTNAIAGITAADGDQVYTWDVNAQHLSGNIATYSAVSHTWDNPNIQLPPGNGFFYMRAGPNQAQWIRNFTAQ